jgi:hypothetical protein
MLDNNKVYYIFKTCCLMSDYLSQNAIYFIILSLYFPIFLTFVINHVLKFKYQTSQVKDNGLFWWERGGIQNYFILCSTVYACLHLP